MEIAHSDKLLQGRPSCKRVLSLWYSYIFSIFFRFLVLDFFHDAMEYKRSSNYKCSLPFPPPPFFHPGSMAPPNHLNQEHYDIRKLLPIFADLLKKTHTHILTAYFKVVRNTPTL